MMLCRILTVSQCDERRQLCENCQRRWGNIEECEWDDIDSGAGGAKSAKTTSTSPPKVEPPIQIKAKPIGPKIDLTLVKSSAADLQALGGAFSPASPLMRTTKGYRIDPFGTHPQGDVNGVDIPIKRCKPLLRASVLSKIDFTFNRSLCCGISALSLATKIRKGSSHKVLRSYGVGRSCHVPCNSPTQCCPSRKSNVWRPH